MTPEEFISMWNIQRVYHFTENGNVPSIRQHGLLSMRELERRRITVARYASSEDSRGVDRHYGMDRYVRLCFVDQHPMEWRARQEGRLDATVFLAVSPEVLCLPGVQIADGVAYGHETVVYDNFATAANQLDWEVLFTRTDWKEQEIKNRLLKARKYEILVPDCVPPKLIMSL